VKAIFLASKQRTAVETSKIWQHALRASNGCFSRRANLSRNASRTSRESHNNTISIPFAVITSLTIMASFCNRSWLGSTWRAVRPLNCIITCSRPSNICKYRCTGGEISYSNYKEDVKEGESVLHSRLRFRVVD